MSAESLYKTSTDYKRLYDLIVAGHQIVCFVDYRFRGDPDDVRPCRDICVAKAFEDEIRADARGIGYLHIFRDYPQCEEVFIKYCQQINLAWVVLESMSIESVLAKELETERTRSEGLEFEVIRLNGLVRDFEEHDTYPPNINACIRDVKNYLKQLQQRKP